MTMKKIVILFYAVLLVACAATGKLQPSEADLPSMQQKVPGVSFEDVKKGYQLYKTNCSGCHRLHIPKEYTIAGWNKNLAEMIPKAKLTEDTIAQRMIRDYLYAGSK